MKDIKIEDMDYDLWLLLTRTQYRIERVRAKELRRFGISPEQSGILFFVQSTKNNAMPIEISRWQLREPQTITSILDRMQKKGLIKKSRDRERKNVIRVALTEKGKLAYENSVKSETYHRIMSVLSAEKRETLREILLELLDATKKFNRHLDAEAEDLF
jgi:DNA-binding MarR family transcriptional regulator